MAEESTCSARMCVGCVRNVRDSVMIGPGMVAENSIVWRCVGEHAEDALDVGQEAQVEHLVGLVEHQPADLRQHQVALLGEVEQAARGADDQVDAALSAAIWLS